MYFAALRRPHAESFTLKGCRRIDSIGPEAWLDLPGHPLDTIPLICFVLQYVTSLVECAFFVVLSCMRSGDSPCSYCIANSLLRKRRCPGEVGLICT